MNINKLTRGDCEKLWGDGQILPTVVITDLTLEERQIRDACFKFMETVPNATEYELDQAFALELYFSVLSFNAGFTMREAADNELWRRLAVQVMPDLVERRWPAKDGIHSKDHFWAKPQRNWLKSLWWYVHLSCQNYDRVSTAACLINGSTDSIQHIVERPGPGGFRINLCRELMKRIGDGTLDVSMLKKVLKLNTSRVCLVEPELYTGGVSGYVDSLVESIL
jgi:hypothetical protein